MKGPLWKTLIRSHLMPTFLKKSVRELERVFFKNNFSWYYLRVKSSGFRLPSFDIDLASTEASSETISLEVIGSTLRVDIIRGEFRT